MSCAASASGHQQGMEHVFQEGVQRGDGKDGRLTAGGGLASLPRTADPLTSRTQLRCSRKHLGNKNNSHENNSSNSAHCSSIYGMPGTESHSKEVAEGGLLAPEPWAVS